MVTRKLTDAGLEVLEAADGAQALATISTVPVDMIIADIDLPGVDGIALLKEQRCLPAYSHSPFFVLTGNDNRQKRNAAMDTGASDWLLKPFGGHEPFA